MKIPVSYHRRGHLDTFPEAPGFNSTNTDKIRPDLLLLSHLYTAYQEFHITNSTQFRRVWRSGGQPTACAHKLQFESNQNHHHLQQSLQQGKTNPSIEQYRDTARHETHPVATTRYRPSNAPIAAPQSPNRTSKGKARQLWEEVSPCLYTN